MTPEPTASHDPKQSGTRKRGAQPGNSNAYKLSGHKPHQRSAKRHEALA